MNQPTSSPHAFFEKTVSEAQQAEKVAQKRINLLAILRLGSFIGLVLGAWLWYRTGQVAYGGLSLVLAAAFLLLMRRQQVAKRKRSYQQNLQLINTDEINRLKFQFTRSDNGLEHKITDHPYAADLDIFGDYSLFRLLNRTRTKTGSKRLAEWLRQPAPLEEILMRQEAITEFAKKPEWRQHWEATALLYPQAGQHIGALRTWVQQTMEPDLAGSLRWRFFPVLTFLVGGAFLAGWIPVWPLLLAIGWQMVILKRYQALLKVLVNQTTELGKTLIAYSELLEQAENSSFSSRWWQQRRAELKQASQSLNQVGQIFDRLDFRNNPYFSIFIGIPTMWDLHCLAGLEDWKRKYRTPLGQWLNVLADTEAINSLAGFCYANPGYVFPQVSWGTELEINAQQLGHPLIARESIVCNDFRMSGRGNTILITGSNMSGKSTFLRTLGINLVLAQTGSVVCAHALACSPVRVFSSMRTQDSLEESTSSFYAELKRLRQLLEYADAPDPIPVFYLLDEILKGTNSADRHKGAEALIKQLHHKNALGLVSTHDLELGEWGSQRDFVENFHFRSDVAEGKLDFDYKLHPGICRSFNASELMRMMGINIEREKP
ncbi:MutS-like protein [Dyadobacter jejuensis]|uniref:MutS-like protein n=1 Tax=Dyadobacter jejuensis TaxID=1082580 RepID=A0A316AH80_9BACT|nr:MutS family DNA mismatch repair protein [Dyadobacter jejuensis]PWJ56991.1 MutS-like protein [Dyadobacter jejuensis]